MNANTLEVAIALAGIYFLLALVLSILVEMISSMFGWRAKMLQQNIDGLLGDERLSKAFYGHPTIRSLWSRKTCTPLRRKAYRPPSAINPETFSSILIAGIFAEEKDNLEKEFKAMRLTQELVEKKLPEQQAKWPDRRPLITRLQNCYNRAMAESATEENSSRQFGSAFRRAVEDMFSESINRLQGRYKRRIYLTSLIIGFLICFLFSVDSIDIGKQLYQNSQMVDTISASSEALIGDELDLSQVVGDWKKNVATLNLGPFWQNDLSTVQWWSYLCGVLLSVLAIAQGAPFWYDLIGKFINIRAGGSQSAPSRSREADKPGSGPGTSLRDRDIFLVPRLSMTGQLLTHIGSLRDPPGGFSVVRASVLSGLSACAYQWKGGESVPERENGEWSVTSLGYIPGGTVKVDKTEFRPDTQVFAVESPGKDVLVLVFRGTELNRLPDIWTNSRFEQVSLGNNAGMVHRGFLMALDGELKAGVTLQEKLDETVGDYAAENRQFWVTGHSLGGALANLFIARWLRKCEPEAQCFAGSYTFGTPRIGDSVFARFLDSRSHGRVIRMVNDLDIITRIPPGFGSFGYKHTRLYYRFDSDGDLVSGEGWMMQLIKQIIERLPGRNPLGFKELTDEFIRDHSISEYHRLCTAVVNRHGEVRSSPRV